MAAPGPLLAAPVALPATTRAHLGKAGGAADERRHRAVGGRAVSQLAVLVVAPAVRRPCGRASARVAGARADLDEGQGGANESGNQAIGGGPVTELARVVESPT